MVLERWVTSAGVMEGTVSCEKGVDGSVLLMIWEPWFRQRMAGTAALLRV